MNPNCVIIGEGSLPIICGELLRERGYEILALVSPDPRVSGWGQSNGIAHAPGPSSLAPLIAGRQLDFLFSIVNSQRVPDALLAATRHHAINYHDGPLPRYAGTHATSWALLNGERRHAVTWHVMTRRVDGGDILKQVPVEIAPDDTALTLNAKCFEAAITGFQALLDDVAADAIEPRAQNPRERTFFRRSQRPLAGCTLRFDAPAEQLDALWRALDFGPYPNPLGLPKIALGESFAIVTELEVLEGRSGDAPGTITAISDDDLVVATASEDVALGGFLTIDGVPTTIAEVVERGGLRLGAQLAAVEKDRSARLTALCAELSGHEPFWAEQLALARPTALPTALRPTGALPRIASHRLALDSAIRSLALPVGMRPGDRLLAVLVATLGRLTGRASIEFAFSESRLRADIGDLHPYFSTCLPLRVAGDCEGSLAQLAEAVEIQLAQVREHRSYARDLAVRDPACRARPAADASGWPVLVELLEGAGIAPPAPSPPGRVLTARLDADDLACTFWYDPDVLDPALVERLSRQFMILLRGLPNGTEQPLWTLPLPEAAAPGSLNS